MQDPLNYICNSLPDQPPTKEEKETPEGFSWMLVSIGERAHLEARRRRRERKHKKSGIAPELITRNKVAKKSRRNKPRPSPVIPATRPKISYEFKIERAKEMKENPTPSEKILRDAMVAASMPFETQVVMFGFIPDFYFKEHHLIVEVDGGIHKTQKDYDRDRDICFHSNGYRVLRFTNQEVKKDVNAVIMAIIEEQRRPKPMRVPIQGNAKKNYKKISTGMLGPAGPPRKGFCRADMGI